MEEEVSEMGQLGMFGDMHLPNIIVMTTRTNMTMIAMTNQPAYVYTSCMLMYLMPIVRTLTGLGYDYVRWRKQKVGIKKCDLQCSLEDSSGRHVQAAAAVSDDDGA